jgi:hypothetical protein
MTEDEVRFIVAEHGRLSRFVRKVAQMLYQGPGDGPRDEIDVDWELRRGSDGSDHVGVWWDGPTIRGESIGTMSVEIPLSALCEKKPAEAEGEQRESERQLLCPHMAFRTYVEVGRLTDSGRFMADIRIVCENCRVPFAFKGLPAGLDLGGAACSPDGLEGRFAIAPGVGGLFGREEGEKQSDA